MGAAAAGERLKRSTPGTGVPSEVFRREIRQGYKVCRLARSLGGLGFRLPTALGSDGARVLFLGFKWVRRASKCS